MSALPPVSKDAAHPKVFIVDDHAPTRNMVAAILCAAGQRCESFASAKEFLQAFHVNATGCLVLDIRMPEMTGPQLQEVLVERGCRLPIIFLTAAADVPTAVSVLQRGAVTLIEKPFTAEVLIRAVDDAIKIASAQQAQALELNDLHRRMSQLTPREREVADLLASGKTNRQTAIALGLSERTVEIHRGRIMAKMKCDSIIDLGLGWHKLQASIKRSQGGITSPGAGP
jgi:FixJ family two-component response regulator